ncbi:MAG: metallophosphoesterase family protein [Planctomycetaceae bacterium]
MRISALTLVISFLLVAQACCLSAGMGQESSKGQVAETKSSEPPAAPLVDHYPPSLLPDRVVLTWTGDPVHTQSVTWRTSTDAGKTVAQIAVDDGGPNLEKTAKTVLGCATRLKTDSNEALFHSVIFEGLTPKTRYAYRVGDEKNWSEWFQFQTASEQSEPFSFLYFGDAQNDLRSRWSRVIRAAYRDAPKAAFMIHAGDLINTAEKDQDWGEWFGAGAFLNAMVPSVPVPGNHEQAKVDDTTRRLTHHWRPSFTLPENGPPGLEESCYTLVYQGVRIIALNSNTQLTEQKDWLEKTLANNTEKWVICTFHHPIFSTGKDRDNKALRELWKPVFDKYRVDLVLTGHDHTYGRTGITTPTPTADLSTTTNEGTGLSTVDQFTGTVYVVSVSGPKMYNVQKRTFMSRHAEDTQLYQIIRIDGDRLIYEAYTAAGSLYDAFTLTKQSGAPNQLVEQIPETPERLRPPVEAVPKSAAEALK